FTTLRQNTRIGIFVDEAVYQVIRQHIGIARIIYFDAAQHLADNHLDVFVVDIHTSVTVNALYFFDQVQLDSLAALDAQHILWITLTRCDRSASLNLLTIRYNDGTSCKD